MKRVVVVDYGLGNLLSVMRALAEVGAEPVLSDNPAEIAAADRLTLPGVGAFGDGMEGLRARGLIEPLQAFAAAGRPFLGVCLGMQLMMDESEEFGRHAGLGLIPGRVVKVPATTTDGRTHRIPHIGWRGLTPAPHADWAGGVLDGVQPGEATYFVHSFMAEPEIPAHRLADCVYGGRTVAAVVRRDGLIGCQFHPEKSGPVGLRILANFVNRL